MIIKIPFKTPTINHLYGQRGRIRFMYTKAKELRSDIDDLINTLIIDNPLLNDELQQLKDNELRVIVEVFEDWYTLDDRVKKKDISNREKFLIDSVFDALGLEDKYIFDMRFIKRHLINEEFAIIRIEKHSELQD